MAHRRRITIFDTTLRDGEQSRGIAHPPGERVEVARALDRPGGRHAFRRACEEAGVKLSYAEPKADVERYEALADSSRSVTLHNVFEEVAA